MILIKKFTHRGAVAVLIILIAIVLQSAPRTVNRQKASTALEAKEDSPLSMIGGACRTADYAKARALTGRLSTEALRSRALQVIDFAEAGAALERGDIVAASSLAGGLPVGVKRVLLQIAIARRLPAAGERQSVIVRLHAAAAHVPSAKPEHRSALLSLIAETLRPLDPGMSLTFLDQAVHPRESQASRPSADSVDLIGTTFFEIVSEGKILVCFPARRSPSTSVYRDVSLLDSRLGSGGAASGTAQRRCRWARP